MPTGMPFWTGAGSVINLTAQGAISTTGFANLPAAADNPRVIAFVPDVGQGGSMWFSDGTMWRPVSRRIPLFVINGGDSGLVFTAGSGEQLYGTEIMIPGGVIRPGDILWDVGFFTQAAASNSGTRAMRTRAKASSGVGTSDATLCVALTTSTSNITHQTDKANFIVSNTLRVSMPNASFSAGIATGAAASATIPSVASDVYVRPTFENSSDQNCTLRYYSLWLERSGL